MRGATRGAVLLTITVLALLLAASPVPAMEYRLLVANIYERTLTSYLAADELYDNEFGAGLNTLAHDLDIGEMDRRAIVPERSPEAVPASLARVWGGVAVRPGVRPHGNDIGQWNEIRWQGAPGERSIWIVKSTGRPRPQRIMHVILKGNGPIRLFQPLPSSKDQRAVVTQIPMGLIAVHESHGTVWDALLSKALDLRHGMGGVVALSGSPLHADALYLVVDHGMPQGAFKVVITWADGNPGHDSSEHALLQIRDGQAGREIGLARGTGAR